MVRVLDMRVLSGSVNYQRLAGLADDDKPTSGIATGSEFLEVDTGDVYAFDEVGGTWSKIRAGVPADPET